MRELPLEVREAAVEDLIPLSTAVERFRTSLEGARGATEYMASSRFAKCEELLTGDDKVVTFTCVSNEEIVGVLTMGLHEEETETTGSCELLYEREGASVPEIVRLLLHECQRRAGRLGVGALDVMCLPGDQTTKSALEAAGFRARLLTLHRRL